MPLVQAKCTNCGANIQVDNTKDAAICPNCGTAYIVEKAINNYNTVNNISANVVNVYGGNSADFVIRSGVLVKYNGAATEAVIPNTVVIIGKEAFKDCKALTSITIPNSITTIEDNAFENCMSIESVIIPNSVMQIGKCAFMGCSALRSIKLSNNMKEISPATFNGCSTLSAVELPSGIIKIGTSAFVGCTSLSSIEIPESVKELGECIFRGCAFTTLDAVKFPSSISAIPQRTFEGCNYLKDFSIPEHITEIGKWAFFDCKSLSRVFIHSRVESIDEGAFWNCPLQTVDIYGVPWIQYDDDDYRGAFPYDRNTGIPVVTASDECKRKNYWCFDWEEYKPAPSKKSGACYIATAVYGSYDCPQVWVLRRFRDNTLSKTWYGSLFIKIYYTISPTFVKWFGKARWFKNMWKPMLDNIVSKLIRNGINDTPYNDN